MIPMDPYPDDYLRQLAERRERMLKAQQIAYLAHSRTGLLFRYLRRLADRIDPTGRSRKVLR
jgi:hypothetical protein